jgi:hypothetical protein
MKNLSSDELHDAMKQALAEVDRRLAEGTLNQSGQYYTDNELAAVAAGQSVSKLPATKVASA